MPALCYSNLKNLATRATPQKPPMARPSAARQRCASNIVMLTPRLCHPRLGERKEG